MGNEPVVHSRQAETFRHVGTRQKAIAFVDCCGYSAYTISHGDRAAVEMLHQLRHHLTREALFAEVAVVKWLGDGAMIAAESAIAALSSIYRTMIAARRLGLLPIRAGVTFGAVEVVEDNDLDYLGVSVNRAARLCAAAAPWQARADAGAARQLHFTLRPHDISSRTAAM